MDRAAQCIRSVRAATSHDSRHDRPSSDLRGHGRDESLHLVPGHRRVPDGRSCHGHRTALEEEAEEEGRIRRRTCLDFDAMVRCSIRSWCSKLEVCEKKGIKEKEGPRARRSGDMEGVV